MISHFLGRELQVVWGVCDLAWKLEVTFVGLLGQRKASLIVVFHLADTAGSDFPARLGLKAGSTAQLWEASGL